MNKFAEQFYQDIEKRANEKIAVSTYNWLTTALGPEMTLKAVGGLADDPSRMDNFINANPELKTLLNARNRKAQGIYDTVKKFMNIEGLDAENTKHILKNIPANFIKRNMK